MAENLLDTRPFYNLFGVACDLLTVNGIKKRTKEHGMGYYLELDIAFPCASAARLMSNLGQAVLGLTSSDILLLRPALRCGRISFYP